MVEDDNSIFTSSMLPDTAPRVWAGAPPFGEEKKVEGEVTMSYQIARAREAASGELFTKFFKLTAWGTQ